MLRTKGGSTHPHSGGIKESVSDCACDSTGGALTGTRGWNLGTVDQGDLEHIRRNCHVAREVGCPVSTRDHLLVELHFFADGAARRPDRLTFDNLPQALRVDDQTAIVRQYRQTDAVGLDAFKQDVRTEVARHNAKCPGQAGLFDFMQPNALTTETMVKGSSPDYVDLVHVRPPAGLWLLRQMGMTGNRP